MLSSGSMKSLDLKIFACFIDREEFQLLNNILMRARYHQSTFRLIHLQDASISIFFLACH